MDTGIQGLLFGSEPAAGPTSSDPSTGEINLCALNANSPNQQRAEAQVSWLLGTGAEILVLTELQPTGSARRTIALLDAEGFDVHLGTGWQDAKYFTAVAARRGLDTAAGPRAFDPRVVAVRLGHVPAGAHVVGVYGMTNGMTAESSARRRTFQRSLLDYLRTFDAATLCVAGDLNIIEPDHEPPLAAFERHDHDCYTDIVGLGMRDAYRALRTGRREHSWHSDVYGSQRLDHAFAGEALGRLAECRYDHATRELGHSDHSALVLRLEQPTGARDE